MPNLILSYKAIVILAINSSCHFSFECYNFLAISRFVVAHDSCSLVKVECIFAMYINSVWKVVLIKITLLL